jgi:hypothetical protein
MIGPSVILAGLALGSGEFVFWPYLTYKGGFAFFWACLVAVVIQFFINMEITRWTLATGESAITGFARLSRHWAWVFLFLNIIPWVIPAWARGSAKLASWVLFGKDASAAGVDAAPYETTLAIGGLLACGVALTAGPVIYETLERVQVFLVGLIVVLVIGFAAMLVRSDAVAAQVQGALSVGTFPDLGALQISTVELLGAIAFAGVGGTLNLGQSNYVKDKGYGMGRYIGRITSPITGKEEPVSEIGYHFPHDEANLRRWSAWWKAANLEHFASFLMTCLVCLVLLTLISYSIFHLPTGELRADAARYKNDLDFIWGESQAINERLGTAGQMLFLVMGIAILFTTEIGVLDATSRISMDIVKVNWLRDSRRWTESRLYYVFLWSTILVGAGILWIGEKRISSFGLFKATAALNGAVMFLYCLTLIFLNMRTLPPPIRMRPWRLVIMVLAVLFFGGFAAWAGIDVLF